jgi:hypothetical protein
MCDVKNGPGKFESEPCYAEEIYNLLGEGLLEEEDNFTFFTPDEEFKKKHNISSEVNQILIEEDDNGFVFITEIIADEGE